MDAEVFVLGYQLPLVAQLTQLFAKHIDAGLPVSVATFGSGSSEMTATRYVKLLQASIPPEVGLKLEMKTVEMFGTRIYLRVYWPMSASSTAGGNLELSSGRSGEYFFPAVAIHDRMVIVPVGQDTALSELSKGGPIDLALQRDLIEVDFKNQEQLADAVEKVGQQLSEELWREFRAYVSQEKPDPVDDQAVARVLEVPVDLLRRSLSEQSAARAYGQLSFELDREKLPVGKWTKVSMRIRNDSSRDLPGVRVVISGPLDYLPSTITVDLAPQSDSILVLSLRPRDEGDFPMEVAFVLTDDAALSNWLPKHHVWLSSGQS